MVFKTRVFQSAEEVFRAYLPNIESEQDNDVRLSADQLAARVVKSITRRVRTPVARGEDSAIRRP